MLLNEIDQDLVQEQVGKGSFDRARRLCRWLFKRITITHRYRVAPSPITRSEAELFGVCAPRFCFRKYVYEQSLVPQAPDLPSDVGFINLRRLAWLRKSVSRVGSPQNQLLADAIQKEGVGVADSLLVVPSWLAVYDTLTCDLWHYYGEPERHSRQSAVPFIQHISLGGGMCAQACLFMTLCILEPLVKRILSISEITVLSARKSPKDQAFSVRTGGMSSAPMISFLQEKCGLAAFHEAELPAGDGNLLATIGPSALDGYLQSGFPVICLVSLGRLSGLDPDMEPGEQASSVYHTNELYEKEGYINPESCKVPELENHAVVLVGVDSRHPDRYLINDPASVPFLEASYKQLDQSRCYADLKTKRLSERLSFISILPKVCKLPLICRKAKQPLDGLFMIASRVYDLGAGLVAPLPRWKDAWPGTVRLLDMRPNADQSARLQTLSKWFKKLPTAPINLNSEQYDEMMTVLHNKIRQVSGDHQVVWLHRLTVPGSSTSKLYVWVADEHPTDDGKGTPYSLHNLSRFVLGVFEITHATLHSTQLWP